MIKYLFVIISISIIIIIYLVRNKTIEPISNIAGRSETTNSNTSIHPPVTYLTNNLINYDLLDKNIDTIDQQYTTLAYRIKNFKMNIGTVETSLYHNENPQYPTKNPNISITGSYPSNLTLNFQFPPPFPGDGGEKGDVGKTGPNGEKGKTGIIGLTGGNNRC